MKEIHESKPAPTDSVPRDQMLSLLKSIRRIVRANDLSSRALQKSSGLTAPQLAVLTAVAGSGEISTSRIAAEVDLSAATVVTILDNLERRELVSRYRSTEDRRIVFTRLTEAGSVVLGTAQASFNGTLSKELLKLPASRVRLMIENLAALADLLNAHDDEASNDDQPLTSR